MALPSGTSGFFSGIIDLSGGVASLSFSLFDSLFCFVICFLPDFELIFDFFLRTMSETLTESKPKNTYEQKINYLL